jgi:hypothetical protein
LTKDPRGDDVADVDFGIGVEVGGEEDGDWGTVEAQSHPDFTCGGRGEDCHDEREGIGRVLDGGLLKGWGDVGPVGVIGGTGGAVHGGVEDGEADPEPVRAGAVEGKFDKLAGVELNPRFVGAVVEGDELILFIREVGLGSLGEFGPVFEVFLAGGEIFLARFDVHRVLFEVFALAVLTVGARKGWTFEDFVGRGVGKDGGGVGAR